MLEAHHQHHHGSKHDDSNGKLFISLILHWTRSLASEASSHLSPVIINAGSPHWCYIYESPEELPAFVASHNGLADTKFQPAGDSLTATLLHLAQKGEQPVIC